MREQFKYSIQPTTPADISAVIGLLNTEPTRVVPLTEKDMEDRIQNGMTYVAKNSSGKVIGHQGAKVWHPSGVIELGSAVVAEDHRGKGISTQIKLQFIPLLQEEHPEAPIMCFLEKESMAEGVLRNLGFEQKPVSSAPLESFVICPKTETRCYNMTKVEPPPCGCRVFVLEAGKEAKLGK